MIKLTPIVIAALALSLQAGTTIAQDGNRERPERPRLQQRPQDTPRGERVRPAMPLMRALDRNSDNVIDDREITNASESLATLDADEDGKITQEEFRGEPRAARPPGAEGGERRQGRKTRPEGKPADQERPRGDRAKPETRPGRGMGGPLLSALDTARDGTLDDQEIAKASASLRKLDTNGDGKLTPDELRPQRPEGAPIRGQAEDRPAPRSRPNPR